MISQIALVWALCCLTLQPGFMEASSLRKMIQNGAPPLDLSAVSVEADLAHGFLSHPRPKRHINPKWHHNPPDFQAYYKYYNNIGHIEGLYEIDRIRMLYQQMRHLEQVHGVDAPHYQNSLGLPPPPPTKCDTDKDTNCRTPQAAPTGTPAPPAPPLPPSTPPPSTPPPRPPMAQADVLYLCNPKDPQCLPHLVYLPAGATPVLCDPRYHPACQSKTQEAPALLATPVSPPPLPPAPKKSLPPAPPAPIIMKGMEYDCDPYWDPDCLIDHPPRPLKTKTPPPSKEEEEAMPILEPELLGKDKKPAHFLYDYRRELFDPYLYSNPAPDPE